MKKTMPKAMKVKMRPCPVIHPQAHHPPPRQAEPLPYHITHGAQHRIITPWASTNASLSTSILPPSNAVASNPPCPFPLSSLPSLQESLPCSPEQSLISALLEAARTQRATPLAHDSPATLHELQALPCNGRMSGKVPG